MRIKLLNGKMIGVLAVILVLFMAIGGAAEEALAEPPTVVPEGVTEIDLRAVLGGDALDVEDAWMLNADVSVILRRLQEIAGYELILLNMRDLSVLSRTPVSHAKYDYWREPGREDGAFYLLFTPEGFDWDDPEFSFVKAIISPDGTVDTSASVPSRRTVMPGGKTAVRKADDGSLYAVDLDTGEEELLIQGVAGFQGEYSYEAYLGYVPCRDDIEYNVDEDGDSLSIPFPLDEDSFDDYWPYFYREFYVHKPLDEHRFVYTVSGWEWGAGFGVYDLQTRTDHRITGSGFFYGVVGNTLYGATLMADANTYETSPLPETVRWQLGEVYQMEDGRVDYDISPDGRLLAFTGMKSRYAIYGIADGHTVTITDIQTGEVIKAYDIDNPFASEYSVTFYGDTRFMLFFRPEESGSAYIYLFDAEE